ncbi:hypothetical protein K435DRAFT_216370 [Dendrothele bispora CBS 962.96]|uniref:Uncharacterized protein n=1 Tax=Dendrothele bispora (strain CBS 962.96) TaxID=1314807 RepID=A0A4S8LTD5_DENBC|nr:hypothetical protein K435DRAFT_216370 [Dendrothele bispora CBS 962.96]
MSKLGLWTFFIRFRIFIFALCAVISMACSIVFGALLLREWSFYNITQRSVVLGLAIIHGVGAILLYLMIIVRFRIWLDVARLSFYLFSLLGGNTFFAVVNGSYPCNNLGSHTLCRRITWSVIIGSWVQSGLLLLAIASHARPAKRPQVVVSPPPVTKPTDISLASVPSSNSSHWRKGSVTSVSSDSSTTALLSYDDKRSSLTSLSSYGPSLDHKSLLQVPGATPVQFPLNPHSFAGYGWGTGLRTPITTYRPPFSPATSVRSLPLALTFQKPYASHRRRSSLPSFPLPNPHERRPALDYSSPPQYNAVPRDIPVRPLPLPNPFESLMSRRPSAKSVPSSVSSYDSNDTTGAFLSHRGFDAISRSSEPWTPTTTEYLSTHRDHTPPAALLPSKRAWIMNNRAYLMSPGLNSVHSMSASMHSRVPEPKQNYSLPTSPAPSSLLL